MLLQRRIAELGGLLCALTFVLTGCESEAEPATALVVSVKSDLEDLASVEVRVFGRDVDPSKAEPDEAHTAEDVSATSDDAVSIVVSRGSADQVMVAVLGFDEDGNELVQVRKRASFTEGKTMVLPVFLGTVCLHKVCDSKKFQTCFSEESDDLLAGDCVAIPALSESGIFEASKPPDISRWREPVYKMDAGIDSDWDPEAGLDGGDAGDSGDAEATCQKPSLPNAECGLFPQCGCPKEKPACRLSNLDSTPTTRCESAGPVPPNSACTKHTDCQIGYGCISNLCTKYCQEDAQCGPGGFCDQIVDKNKQQIPGSGACWVACNPTTREPCGAGALCSSFPRGTYCDKPACMPTSPPGGSCDLVSQCNCTGTTAACQITGQTNGQVTAACLTAGPKKFEETCSAHIDCAKGSGCFEGICRKYCSEAKDCASGATCRDIRLASMPVTGAKVCSATCDPAVPTSCSAGAICTNVPGEAQHSCLKASPCSGTLLTNGRCDEPAPAGTGLCSKGTDVADCGSTACVAPLPPTPPGGMCDLVTQCGCGTQACGHSTVNGVATIACRAAGTTPPGGLCTSHTQCTKGHACLDGLCGAYCRSDADCGTNGTCFEISSAAGQAVQGVKICGVTCSPTVPTSCPTGYVCPRLNKPFCLIPYAVGMCPARFMNDGFCDEPDEPNGTRLCADGSDVADCT